MGSATAAVITRAVDELELATLELDFGVVDFKGLAEENDPLNYGTPVRTACGSGRLIYRSDLADSAR